MARHNSVFDFLKQNRSFPFGCAISAHSLPIQTQPYRVTSGAYQLKRFRPDIMTLHFEHNPDYYRGRGYLYRLVDRETFHTTRQCR